MVTAEELIKAFQSLPDYQDIRLEDSADGKSYFWAGWRDSCSGGQYTVQEDQENEWKALGYRLAKLFGDKDEAEVSRIYQTLNQECLSELMRKNRTWIFQGNPKTFRVGEAVASLESMHWSVRQHKSEIRKGDRAYIWESGPSGGLIAEFSVETDVFDGEELDEEKAFWITIPSKTTEKRVVLRKRFVFHRKLKRKELQQTEGLADLSLFRMSQATNFAVNQEEAEVLQQLTEPLRIKTRKQYYQQMRHQMELVGFVFEKEQPCHHQNRTESEFKFTHPVLEKKLAADGLKVRGKKYYLKPLSDEPDCDIGLVNGKETPLQQLDSFPASNAFDTNKNTPAWVNKKSKPALDVLLIAISEYLDQSLSPSVQGNLLQTVQDYAGDNDPPDRIERSSYSYKRCPVVKRNVLQKANGHCELCDAAAPFLKSNGSPYLEVHHVVPLERGGLDNVSNAVGICPNCHMRCHHSVDASEVTEALYGKVSRLKKPESP